MQHDLWAKSGAQQPHFPFSGKPDINVDPEDPSNPLEYFTKGKSKATPINRLWRPMGL
jgi:hypothetical protein